MPIRSGNSCGGPLGDAEEKGEERAREVRTQESSSAPQGDWYKRAVVYEVLLPAFQDSNGDGVGDLPGLTQRLDYLAWLGVTCLWLPPFYQSPMRDGGYDVSDFRAVRPACGT